MELAAADALVQQLAKSIDAARKRLDPDHGRRHTHSTVVLPPILTNYKLIKDADAVTGVTGERGTKVKPLMAAILEDPGVRDGAPGPKGSRRPTRPGLSDRRQRPARRPGPLRQLDRGHHRGQ